MHPISQQAIHRINSIIRDKQKPATPKWVLAFFVFVMCVFFVFTFHQFALIAVSVIAPTVGIAISASKESDHV